MTFFDKFTRLFYDMSVYRELIDQKFWVNFRFFLKFYIVFSLIIGLFINLLFTPELISITKNIVGLVNEALPPESTFTIANGHLSTSGIETPIIIDKYFFLDPNANLTMLATTAAYINFGATDIRITSPEIAEPQVLNYARDGFDGNLTGTQITKNFDDFQNTLHKVRPYISLIIALPLFVGLVIARLIYTALYALLFILSSTLLGKKYTFASFWGLTLHTIIIADVTNAVITLIYGQSYPMVFSIAFFGVTLYAYFNLPVATKR